MEPSLNTARRLKGREIPLMGVNFGRLGFLASFTPQQLMDRIEAIVANRLPISRRIMLEASVSSSVENDGLENLMLNRRFVSTAFNDMVITAGAPFHMIELTVKVDDQTAIGFRGDGLIVATPSGSTAYNISAGGPIITPDVPAWCITPICPYSLSFRPLVVSSSSLITITARDVNVGATVMCDGQVKTHLAKGDKVILRRSAHEVLLVENPQIDQLRAMADKLQWAYSPGHPLGEPPCQL